MTEPTTATPEVVEEKPELVTPEQFLLKPIENFRGERDVMLSVHQNRNALIDIQRWIREGGITEKESPPDLTPQLEAAVGYAKKAHDLSLSLYDKVKTLEGQVAHLMSKYEELAPPRAAAASKKKTTRKKTARRKTSG